MEIMSLALITSLPMPQLLQQAEQQGAVSALDRHFALQLSALAVPPQPPAMLLLLALLSKQLSAQHSCLPLAHIDADNPLELRQQPESAVLTCRFDCSQSQLVPQIEQLLNESSLVWVAAAQTEDPHNRPLVLQSGRLYLRRYWHYEQQVASKLRQLACDSEIARRLDHNAELMRSSAALLQGLFPTADAAIDWQKVAAATALTRQLAVITGGPGTGKTTTVTKVLLLLLQLLPTLSIRLVAPTGKAAARLSESIKSTKARLQPQLNGPLAPLQQALQQIPEQAATIHRLLGFIPGDSRFRYHHDNPLLLDLLIVDEASMVDLPLMAKLLDALPDNARLILLGDQDQLASVEAGAVLADICQGLKSGDNWQMRYSQAQALRLSQLCQQQLPAEASASALGDSLCMLRHSHRFEDDAGIGLLANAVNHGDTAAITQIWRTGYQELQWYEHNDDGNGLKGLLAQCQQGYGVYLSLMQQHAEPQQILAAFNQFRVLCAMRSGDAGVENINLAITRALTITSKLKPHSEFYAGRPIIIRSNDYNLGLFNGDIGLILPDASQHNRLMAWFERADGSMLKVLPARLPSHDTCFAMTVHKSQGSEFDSVALVLPTNPRGPQLQLLSRELLYTAITRAKRRFICLGNSREFAAASRRLTRRASGLAQRLWQ
ncbi:exodeoxyribonuclease V subunit alpha [Shewanella fodinae]|uniref:exodeoxyribonuclease V subunit alpha n=1 Tax=Shewanella fodinae TaxID=552357 RepID=UPI0019B75AEA|nr:exodeoxyribonuclease V subunit alpha [Shewanella fodinae]MCL2905655.1 exodeoxyribonuclease V subunit alpha [Shewanella fodinae]GGY92686.1 RecBCD enzyme subunit RecD [Shewanella fodinae]